MRLASPWSSSLNRLRVFKAPVASWLPFCLVSAWLPHGPQYGSEVDDAVKIVFKGLMFMDLAPELYLFGRDNHRFKIFLMWEKASMNFGK